MFHVRNYISCRLKFYDISQAMKKLYISAIIILCTLGVSLGQSSTAIYSVTFTSNWSQAAHPHSSGNLPGSAHWSKLVGATHNDQIHFLEMGAQATPGIEAVAESGSNSIFFSEVNTALGAGTANSLIDGPALGTADGEINIPEITLTDEFPLVSLVTMIAPSPDWIAAVDGLSLLDVNGEWVNTITTIVAPYDAGTDNGIDYISPNSDTVPKDNISSASGIAPFSIEPIGMFVFNLESVVLGVDDIERDAQIILFPNPTTNNVTIRTAAQLANVTIYNALGKMVYNINASGQEKHIDVSGFASGIYLVQVRDSNGNRAVQKLVKL